MNRTKRNSGQGRKRRSSKKSHVFPSHLEMINLNAAGIDIGSEEHYVAVPEDRDESPVRVFKCYTPFLHELARWLRECGIKTVAMESTGVYWMSVYAILESSGFEVKLVNARHVKNVPGRKSDVQDCQWLQRLHTFGLLSGSFVPDREANALRTYWRQRLNLVSSVATQIHLMQKALIQMNLHLHKVLSDVTGKTGLKIIRAIVAGEQDPEILAKHRDRRVKKNEQEIAAALTGDYREEHLFALEQAVELYDIYQRKIQDCDERIARHLGRYETKGDVADLGKRSARSRRKNEPYFDLGSELYRITGVDLTKIDGLDTLTVGTIISDCGTDMSHFPTEKHFSSWYGLCPNNRKTGGRVFKTKTKKVNSRGAQAFRLAAQSLHSSKSALGAFYRRMRARLGAPKAITATAHKLARIFYRMLKYGEEYVDRGQDYYEKAYEVRILNSIKKRAKSMGYVIVNNETGLVVS